MKKEEQFMWIMSTYYEFQIVTGISIECDKKGNLIVSLSTTDEGWEYPQGTWYTSLEKTKAIMSPYEVSRFARKVRIKPEEVLEYLYDGFEVSECSISKKYIEASFSNILNFILSKGAKYRLKRIKRRNCVDWNDEEDDL